jgi:formylglycine-generating enzyme required for sulfatase activity/DNA-binding beta-propeller fold protein YncE
MSWPLSQDYNEAIQSPESSFADPELRGGQPVVNALGLPIPRSGNFADVYQFQGRSGNKWAVKCFTRHVAGLQKRYTAISQHLRQAKLPFTVDFTYLDLGIRIRGQWYPILKMEWVEGFLLNEFVRNNLDKPATLDALLTIWVRMAKGLRDARVAHADLQHGNVILVQSDKAGSLAVKLIDYDGMWVPALANKKSGEVGHAAYQHPQRIAQGIYSVTLDRLPLLAIACALRGLVAGGQGLWSKYDNGDNMLFREPDLRNPAASPLFKELWNSPDVCTHDLVGHLTLGLSSPLEGAPQLNDVIVKDGVRPLSTIEEQQVKTVLGAGAKPVRIVPLSKPAPPHLATLAAPPPQRAIPNARHLLASAVVGGGVLFLIIVLMAGAGVLYFLTQNQDSLESGSEAKKASATKHALAPFKADLSDTSRKSTETPREVGQRKAQTNSTDEAKGKDRPKAKDQGKATDKPKTKDEPKTNDQASTKEKDKTDTPEKPAPLPRLVAFPKLTLPARGAADLQVKVDRQGYAGPINVQVENLPPGVTCQSPATIPAGESSVRIEFRTDGTAGDGAPTVEVIALADTRAADRQKLCLVLARMVSEKPPEPLADKFKTTGAEPLDLGAGLRMEFVHIPKGTFWMGWDSDTKQSKQVTIDQDFELGKYLVTQEEWQNIMGPNPSWFSRTRGGKDAVQGVSDDELKRFPVDNVSWDDAQVYLGKLNVREQGKGWLYRLPKEAEWEYACRNASTRKEDCSFDFYFGSGTNDLSSNQANFDGNFPGGNAGKGPYLKRPTPVGKYAPNKLGLYDMNGNIWQWCDDLWNGPNGRARVIRGGFWGSQNTGQSGRQIRPGNGQGCRAARRDSFDPSYRDARLGLRVSRVPQSPPSAKVFPGLLAYWPFDEGEGDTSADVCEGGVRGKGHNIEWVDGVRGKAIRVKGKGSYFDFSAHPKLSFAARADFTFCSWVRTRQKDGPVLSNRAHADGTPDIDLHLGSGTLRLEVRQQGATDYIATLKGAKVVSDGAWHHFAFTRHGADLALYTDGALEQRLDNTRSDGAIPTDLRALGAELYWLKERNGLDTDYLAGDFDEFCVFGRALSAAEIRTLAGSSDGTKGSTKEAPKAKDANQGQWASKTLIGHDNQVTSIAVSPDGKRAVSGAVDGNVRVWDLETGTALFSFDRDIKPIVSVAFDKDGKQILAASGQMLEDGKRKSAAWIWNAQTGFLATTMLRNEPTPPAHARVLALSPTGNRFVDFTIHRLAGDRQLCTLQVLNLPVKGDNVPHLVHSRFSIQAIAISPDGRQAITAGMEKTDTTLLLWDLDTGKAQPLKAPTVGVRCLAFSEDGKRVLAAGDDKAVVLWDLATGLPARAMAGHAGAVTAVAFSSDGRWALSGSLDKTVRLWDLNTGKELRRFTEHTGAVMAVAFDPNNRFALSGGADKTVRFWELPP